MSSASSAMSVQRIQGAEVARFTAGKVEKRKLAVERIAGTVLGALTIGLVVPLLAILGLLVVKAWPALSWEFLTRTPELHDGGGIWAPLVGTFYLVFISLAVAAPIGVLAGVYLNEYAGDHGARAWSTWRWSTWQAFPASSTRCSASALSCCLRGWAARCWRRAARWQS